MGSGFIIYFREKENSLSNHLCGWLIAAADLGLPLSNRLEALKGERKGQWSIRINDQRRICFEWRDGNAEQVEIVDYH